MSFRSTRLFAASLLRGFSSSSPEKKPKTFRKIVLGSLLGAYGYYQWEHYNRNMELAKKLDIPFYKVRASAFDFLSYIIRY